MKLQLELAVLFHATKAGRRAEMEEIVKNRSQRKAYQTPKYCRILPKLSNRKATKNRSLVENNPKIK